MSGNAPVPTTRPGFEGSYGGDDSRISDQAVMECGVCWLVYDPAAGDDYWQIPAGTAFRDLPEHWTCPGCSAERHQFMVHHDPCPPTALPPVLEGEGLTDSPDPGDFARARQPALPELESGEVSRDAEADEDLGNLVRALKAEILAADSRMKSLPLYCERLRVELSGFQRYEIPGWGCIIGIVITPWYMNLVLIPPAAGGWDAGLGQGDKEIKVLPAGRFPFTAGEVEGVGMILTCSLFSPMGDFQDQEAARLTAVAALNEILGKGDQRADSTPQREVSGSSQISEKRASGLFGESDQAVTSETKRSDGDIDRSKRALFRGSLVRRRR